MINYTGLQLGRYRLIRSLGTGGFAEVYLAEHVYLGTQHAIKIINALIDANAYNHFLQEARTLASLEHPHIVRITDFGIENNIPFLVMNHAAGGSLRTRHPRGTPLAVETILPYVTAIASALQHAHDHKVIHRDVKPDNMLVGPNGEVLLSDFGIAAVAHSTASRVTQDIVGTAAYMAPEQINGHPGIASDQYALAVVIYEWLTGDYLFAGKASEMYSQHLMVAPKPLRVKVPSISPYVEQAVLKGLAKMPQDRYATVTSFAKALQQACTYPKTSVFPTSTVSGSPQLILASPPQTPAMIHDVVVTSASLNPIHQGQTIPAPSGESQRLRLQEKDEACFICSSFDTEPCAHTELEGQLLSAFERTVENESRPCVTIRTAQGLARIALPTAYRSFVKELMLRGKPLHPKEMVLRIYHLPAPVRSQDYNGERLYHYIATSYTMAVLEPDTLLNISDLAQANYCSRQYMLKRLFSSSPSVAAIRGNIVHYCFKEMLKKLAITPVEEQTPLASMQHSLEDALKENVLDMALIHVSPDEMREEVMPHLEKLSHWYQRERTHLWASVMHTGDQNQVRAETFLLVPKIGLRGRLDLFWEHAGQQQLLELKTGGTYKDQAKSEHRWQVYGYHAQLTVRRLPKMKKAGATLVYSGTVGQAQSFRIPFSIRDLQLICATRNILILSQVSGVAPVPPGPSRCTRCVQLSACQTASTILGWQPPQPEIKIDVQSNSNVGASNAIHTISGVDRSQQDSKADHAFIATCYDLLAIEGREAELQQALLWYEKCSERVNRGVALDLPRLDVSRLDEHGGWIQTFDCDNQSELRKGDEILLSDGDPVRGNEVVTGTITDISKDKITVWTPELIDNPSLIDRYSNDLVHLRTLQNLMRWLDVDSHLRDLVAGRVRPRFTQETIDIRDDFNHEQQLAVLRALQMQDYLLIQGPPGTGKTAVIAEIVKQLVQRGQRVLLAAFTNQAVDNMLKRLMEKEGFTNFVRLGSEHSIDEEKIKNHLIQNLLAQYTGDTTAIDQFLCAVPVVASTTATWSSEKYALQERSIGEVHPLSFDVAIVDEASQLTVPALLGALRFAKRFILVGDEKQLPPLVLSKEAAESGLAESLFEQLKKANENEKKDEPGLACVSLLTQYRMHATIAEFASKEFYGGNLRHGEKNRAAVLPLQVNVFKLFSEPMIVKQIIDPKLPLVFVDVRGHTAAETTVKSSKSEAEVVNEIVRGLLARKVAPSDIGIIAPYRAQVANLRNILFSKQAEQITQGITIDTVDRFQGGERKVIIISFATTHKPSQEMSDFLTNSKRLNVALTRAQHKLILVGHAPTLETLHHFSSLIAYCRDEKALFEFHL